jgi:Flavin containing amine oxidoreductase
MNNYGRRTWPPPFLISVRIQWPSIGTLGREDRSQKASLRCTGLGHGFTLREPLPEHQGNVRFAGEHIAADQGFMEGATVSGQQAAPKVESYCLLPGCRV